MLEAFMLATGVVVVIVGVLALGAVTGLMLAWWETWWLHPVWSMVMVPLGLPAIDFWHLFAVNLFVSVMFFSPAAQDYAKEPDQMTRRLGTWARLLIAFIRPALAYYVIRWAL